MFIQILYMSGLPKENHRQTYCKSQRGLQRRESVGAERPANIQTWMSCVSEEYPASNVPSER